VSPRGATARGRLLHPNGCCLHPSWTPGYTRPRRASHNRLASVQTRLLEYALGLKSGFRISELLSLRIGDVWQHGHTVDRVTVARRHMKKRLESRTIVLHPDARAALEVWPTLQKSAAPLLASLYLFRSRQGVNRPISRVQAWRIFEEAYTTNGFTGKLGTHALRKTFADRIYERLDHDLVKSQQALGHKNINSTVSYFGFRQEDIDQAMLAL
jgi:integrase